MRNYVMGLRPTAIVLASLLAIALAHAQEPPGTYVTWRAGLSSAGQPSAAWLRNVKAAQVDLVINLAPPGVHGSIAGEADLVRAQGVPYVNIPVDFARPTREDFERFSDLVRANTGRNVFVHCQVNLRGSAFVFLYRVIHEGADLGDAMRKLTGVWIPDRTWKRFIEETLAANGKKAELL